MKLPGKGIWSLKLTWIIIFILIWEITARSGLFSPQLFPDLGLIIKTLIEELLSGELIAGTLRSLLLILGGMTAGMVMAALFSTPAFFFSPARSLLDALTAIMHPLPGIALLPIFILFFGIGTAPVFWIMIHSVLWPLCINIRSGFESIPPIYLKIGENHELSRSALFRRIMLPAAFPQILAGLRIAWARSWRALISSEMIFGMTSGKGGLGWYIFNKRLFMDTPGMYAGILVLILIGLAVETLLFRKLDRVTTRRWSMNG